MAYQFPPEIERLVREHMRTGQYTSEDDMLADALRALAIHRLDLEAIRAGLTDLEDGNVRPLTDVVADIRDKHSFTDDGDVSG